MALVTTPAAANATAYSTLADALIRAALDVRGTAFVDNGDSAVQESLLAMATVDIDSALLSTGRLLGERTSDTQSLQLPRGGAMTLPAGVVVATQLLAFHYAERLALGEIGTPIADTSRVKEDTIGPITTTYYESKAPTLTAYESLPIAVRGLLESTLRRVWLGYGVGTAVRGS